MGWFGTSTTVSSQVSSITLDAGSSKTLWYVDSTSVEDVTFSSDDTSTATVSRGSLGTNRQRRITVRGISAGSTYISASTGDSLSVIVNSTSSGGGDSGDDDDDDSGGSGSGSGSGGGSSSSPSMSGPSTTSMLEENCKGQYKFTISGFSDYDAVDWTSSQDNYADIESYESGYAYVSIYRNYDFTYTITATNSATGEKASKTVTNVRTATSFDPPDSISIAIGETRNVSVSFSPTDISSVPSISGSSSSSSIATVSSNGSDTNSVNFTITGKGEGSATITWSVYGKSVGTTAVSVYDSSAVSVDISGPSTVYNGEDATFTADCEETVTWQITEYNNCGGGFTPSGNTCTVNLSITSDLAPASFVIKASYGANSDSMTVSVKEALLSGLVISGPDEMRADDIQEYTAMPTIAAGNLSGLTYEWNRVRGTIGISNHDKKTCRVNTNDVKEEEIARISVTCAEFTAYKDIVVKYIKAEDILLEGVEEDSTYDGRLTTAIGYNTEFTATVIPEDSNDTLELEIDSDGYYNVNKTQANPHTIYVTANGAGKEGNYPITLTAGDISKTVLFEVVDEIIPVETIELDRTAATIKVGRSTEFAYTLLPEDANAGRRVEVYGTSADSLNIDVATITSGGGRIRVTGVGEGEISFYLKTETAQSKPVKVTVVSNSTKYTITYDGNGGTPDRASDTVQEGGSVKLPSATRSGYTMSGWEDDSGKIVGSYGARFIPDRSTKLTAVWTRPQDEEGAFIQVSYDGRSRVIYLDHVTGIEDTYTAQLTRISTVIYGVDNRFVMDLGTVRRIDMSITRDNPFPYDDSSDDDREWSNGKWYMELEHALDFWQNLGCDYRSFEQVGGIRLKYNPLDEDLYPEIDENVFVTGTLSPNFSVQKLTLTIPFTVARMDDEGSTVGKTCFKLISNVPDQSTDVITEKWYPKGTTMPIPIFPSFWDADGYAFDSWNTLASGTGTRYEPGVPIEVPDTELVLYGQWVPPKAAIISSVAGENTLTEMLGTGISYSADTGVRITSQDITRMMVLAVGGGGGCGGGVDSRVEALFIFGYNSAGGAGGSGDVVQNTFSVSYGQNITYTVGKGGSGRPNADGTSGADGQDGGASSVYIEDIRFIEAQGGDGGEGAPYWSYFGKEVSGGEGVYAGGSVTGYEESGSGIKGGVGGNGKTGSPNIEANVGVGAKPRSDAANNIYHAGGAGGGAAALNHDVRVGTTKRHFESKGGNGTCKGRGKDGILGGGGGSGSGDIDFDDNGHAQGDGGDGLVVLVFY